LRWILLTVIYKKSLAKVYAQKNLIYLISPITFALTDCPSHRSFIPIQRSKNKNSKTEAARITNPFSYVFIYKKRDERDIEAKEERNKKQRRERRNKNQNPTISTSNGHSF
jgi:hypothetical protein